jgi:hypothetical protein
MEQKKQRGGARPNSGRMKKDELISLIESMDAVLLPESVWIALSEKVEQKDVNAIKTWLQYRYGMPKQVIDQNTNLNVNEVNLKELLNFDNTKR